PGRGVIQRLGPGKAANQREAGSGAVLHSRVEGVVVRTGGTVICAQDYVVIKLPVWAQRFDQSHIDARIVLVGLRGKAGVEVTVRRNTGKQRVQRRHVVINRGRKEMNTMLA